MAPRPNRVRAEGPLVTVGMVWSHDCPGGAWRTALVRRFLRAKRDPYQVSELAYIDQRYEFCPGCLSMDLHYSDTPGWITCQGCKRRYHVIVGN
jgi:hypothetical protein